MDIPSQMPPSIQRLPARSRLSRHLHDERYAAVVLQGGYLEAGSGGRLRAEPGMVVVHEAYAAHMNVLSNSGAAVLNLPLATDRRHLPQAFWIPDTDRLAITAEHDPVEAAELLVPVALVDPLRDWPDELARQLEEGGSFSLREWGFERGLTPASISRGFRSAFGVSPKRFRAEARALAAVTRLTRERSSIAEVAAEEGFADQSHLTRAVGALTGLSPKRLRQAKWVQDANPEPE